MPEAIEVFEAVPEETPAIPKGHAVLAWLVILLTLLFAAFLVPEVRPPRPEMSPERLGLVVTSMYARYLVGAADLLHKNQAINAQANALNAGPLEQRWRYIIVVGELDGSTVALEKLAELDHEIRASSRNLTPTERAIDNTLYRLYRNYSQGRFNAPAVKASERQLLRGELGWFGELALAPAEGNDHAGRQAVLGAAQRTFVVIITGFVLASVACLAGFIALTVFVIFLFTGQLRVGLRRRSGHGAIYAEAFALWILMFLALGLGVALLPAGDTALLLSGLAGLLSLTALGWPVVRGIPWKAVRQDIGLVAGRQPALEPAIGAVCYMMALPMLAIGLLITFILLAHTESFGSAGNRSNDFSPAPMPAHPIIAYAADAGWWPLFQVFFVASVVAPLVEETMFRGVLYRHLRDASARLGSAISIITSATVVNFLFAGLHPQGPAAIPALMALAYGLTLAREWRGTLVPGIVAHGLNNGLLLAFLILAVG
jgi:membrane protease YdiL (CAAX protease family)